jgi:hypothetical protein
MRAFIRARIDFMPAYVLMSFSGRAASLGVQQGNPDLIRDGLVAQVIEDLACGDPQSKKVVFSMIVESARKLQLDPVALFDEAAEMASPNVAQFLREFPRRPDLEEELRAMGLWGGAMTEPGADERPES